MDHNVLFLVFEFPPVQTTGGLRPLKFTKYLPQFGITPVVVAPTVESGSRAFGYAQCDENLLLDVPKSVEIHRVKTDDYSKYYRNKLMNVFHHYFHIGDLHGRFWVKHVMVKVSELVKTHHFSAIYVCCPPFSIAQIGVNLSKKYGLPLLLDMRDHWSLWGTSAYISKLHYRLNYRKEANAFKQAKKVVSVTDQVIADFKKDHDRVFPSKFVTIPNGFDEEGMDFSPLRLNFTKQQKIRIGYMGEFYYSPEAHKTMFTPWYKKKIHQYFQYSPRKEDYRYRSPFYFLMALNTYFERYPEQRNRVEFHYVGAVHGWLETMLQEFDLAANVVLYGRVNYAESLRISKSFDVCLSTSSKVIGGEDYCLASKTFDYLTLRKPVLGFVTNGSHRNFLKASGIAFLCEPDDIAHSVEVMHKLFNEPTILNYNQEYLLQFGRRATAKKMASTIKSMLQEKIKDVK